MHHDLLVVNRTAVALSLCVHHLVLFCYYDEEENEEEIEESEKGQAGRFIFVFLKQKEERGTREN